MDVNSDNNAEDTKMNVKFEESQLPSPLSDNRHYAAVKDERSATHIYGMGKQRYDDNSSSYSSDREDLLQEHRIKY